MMAMVLIFHIMMCGMLCIHFASAAYVPGVGGIDNHHRMHKRATGRPCMDKYKRLSTHSACGPPATNSRPLAVSDEDRELIVTLHNTYRSGVQPSASNMLKMSWDDEIAMIAQAWAETCSLKHDKPENRDIPGRLSLGQNIGDGFTSWTGVIDAWYAEVEKFTFNSDTNVFEEVGHYTQGVWADTNKLGCGAAHCDKIIFYVCDYGPAGNIDPYYVPYETGAPCSACTHNCDHQLCACGEQVCENGGEMNRTSCQCQCHHPWLANQQCQLDCGAVKEPYYCGAAPYDEDSCDLYENVPHDCPTTCHVCPYSDFIHGAFTTTTTSTTTTTTTTATTTTTTTEPTREVEVTQETTKINTPTTKATRFTSARKTTVLTSTTAATVVPPSTITVPSSATNTVPTLTMKTVPTSTTKTIPTSKQTTVLTSTMTTAVPTEATVPTSPTGAAVLDTTTGTSATTTTAVPTSKTKPTSPTEAAVQETTTGTSATTTTAVPTSKTKPTSQTEAAVQETTAGTSSKGSTVTTAEAKVSATTSALQATPSRPIQSGSPATPRGVSQTSLSPQFTSATPDMYKPVATQTTKPLTLLTTFASSGHNFSNKENGSTTVAPTSASNRACADKFAATERHSACLPRSPAFVSGGVSERDRELIMTHHNYLRSSVSPPASDMMRLRWDTELALVAEGWAETCNTYSDPPTLRTVPGTWSELGQNMAVNGSSWSDVFRSWWQGKDDLDKVNGSYKQYAQVVWASTVRVGCGFADCGAFHVHVCNYAPSMNMREMTSPYRPGTPCQHCPHTCGDNLCDCDDQRCENLAVLDPVTCTCQCVLPFHRQPTCSLSCSDVEEASFCKHSSLATCSSIHNMAVYCPWLCNVCPFGGHDYKNSSSSNTTNDNNNKVKSGSTSGSSRCCLGYGSLLVTCFWGVFFINFHTTG